MASPFFIETVGAGTRSQVASFKCSGGVSTMIGASIFDNSILNQGKEKTIGLNAYELMASE